MVHQRVAPGRRRRLAAQQREHGRTVLGGGVRQPGAERFGHRREQIELADQVRRARPGRRHARPARDERDAMAAFERVGFRASIASRRVVAQRAVIGDVAGRRVAVVAGEDDESVPRKPVFIERREDPPDIGIDLAHEIPVRRGRGACERLRGQRGRMRRGQREVEEERLGVAGRPPLGKVGDRLLGEPRLHVFHPEVAADGPGAPEPWCRVVVHQTCRRRRHTIVIEPDIRRHVQRRADAEEPIEPVRNRAASDKSGVVDVLLPRSQLRPVQPEMPLAEHRGDVALRAEKPRQREPAAFEQARAVALQGAALERPAPRVPPGEQRVPRWRAHRR